MRTSVGTKVRVLRPADLAARSHRRAGSGTSVETHTPVHGVHGLVAAVNAVAACTPIEALSEDVR